MPIGRLAPNASTARGVRKLADRQREAVDDGQLGIVRDLVVDPLPEALLHHLQVRRLPDNRCVVEMGERQEEVQIVLVKA